MPVIRNPDSTKKRLTPIQPGCVAAMNLRAQGLNDMPGYCHEKPCSNTTPMTAMPRSVSSSGMKGRIRPAAGESAAWEEWRAMRLPIENQGKRLRQTCPDCRPGALVRWSRGSRGPVFAGFPQHIADLHSFCTIHFVFRFVFAYAEPANYDTVLYTDHGDHRLQH